MDSLDIKLVLLGVYNRRHSDKLGGSTNKLNIRILLVENQRWSGL